MQPEHEQTQTNQVTVQPDDQQLTMSIQSAYKNASRSLLSLGVVLAVLSVLFAGALLALKDDSRVEASPIVVATYVIFIVCGVMFIYVSRKLKSISTQAAAKKLVIVGLLTALVLFLADYIKDGRSGLFGAIAFVTAAYLIYVLVRNKNVGK